MSSAPWRLSLYAHVEPGASRRELQTRVSSLLDEIRPLAKDRMVEHEGRISARDDIARIEDALSEEQWPPGAIAIFACSGRDLYAEVPLPQSAWDRVIVDARPYSRPMLAVLEEYDRSCVVLIDAASARLWDLRPYQTQRFRDRRGAAVPVAVAPRCWPIAC